MLKLIAGTIRPTSGTVEVHGRVFALLELGAGFHPDLTGQENIFLNGSFIGLSQLEMTRHFNSIVGFSELEKFIDTPLRHYSSGMQMRLGFAIAAHVNPDILIIDEVLAVGDASFRQKCFATLADFKRQGKTIIFVSHDAVAVRRFCDEVLWLEAGRVRETGDPEIVTRAYLTASQENRNTVDQSGTVQKGDGLAGEVNAVPPISLNSVQCLDPSGTPKVHFDPGQPVSVCLSYEARTACDDVTFAVGLHRPDGTTLHTTTTRQGGGFRVPAGAGEVLCDLGVLPLGPGEYMISAGVWLGMDWRGAGERRFGAVRFSLEPRHAPGTTLLELSPQWIRLPETTDLVAGSSHRRGTGCQPVCWLPPPSHLVMGKDDEMFLGQGWYPTEDWPPAVRWMGLSASVFLTQDDLAQSVGITVVRPHHGPRPATGRVLVDNRIVGTFMLASPGLENFTYSIAAVPRPCPVEVRIEVDEPLIPADLGLSDDTRHLGIAVSEVWFE